MDAPCTAAPVTIVQIRPVVAPGGTAASGHADMGSACATRAFEVAGGLPCRHSRRSAPSYSRGGTATEIGALGPPRQVVWTTGRASSGRRRASAPEGASGVFDEQTDVAMTAKSGDRETGEDFSERSTKDEVHVVQFGCAS